MVALTPSLQSLQQPAACNHSLTLVILGKVVVWDQVVEQPDVLAFNTFTFYFQRENFLIVSLSFAIDNLLEMRSEIGWAQAPATLRIKMSHEVLEEVPDSWARLRCSFKFCIAMWSRASWWSSRCPPASSTSSPWPSSTGSCCLWHLETSQL